MFEKLPLELIDKCFKNKIILLRMTSKRIRDFLNIIQQPIALTINSKWLRNPNNGNITIKHNIIIKSIITFNNNISKLVLNNCRLGSNEAHQLEQALKNNTHLIFLNLKANLIGSDGMKFVGKIIIRCPLLQHLDISCNNINYKGAYSLARWIGMCIELKHLNLESNQIGPKGINSLKNKISILPIEFLNISNNCLGSVGIKFLENLESLTIKYLNLSNNQIKSDDVNNLAQMLSQCPNITDINLSNNLIRLERFPIGMCGNLEYLDLSHNQIGDDGIQSLANVLEEGECKTLLSLNLSNNKISDIGAYNLARVLGECKSLVCLKLLDNQIGSIGINKIKEVYKGKRILKI
jgi:Ran GTPase-activating protein (RanGAP) involved in mRNA processing and transport